MVTGRSSCLRAIHLTCHRIISGWHSRRLDDTDVILGPCDDGGYYLIGLRFPAPEVFAGIPWSTSRVLDLTIERAREAGMTCERLPSCYDIDTWEDVERLMHDIQVQAFTVIRTDVLRQKKYSRTLHLSCPDIEKSSGSRGR